MTPGGRSSVRLTTNENGSTRPEETNNANTFRGSEEDRQARGEEEGRNERENENNENIRTPVNTGSRQEDDMSKMLWSARRPSQWSRTLGVGSDAQYDPAKYLPVNSRADYYTEPSGAELAARTMTELQHVRAFAVGRHGVGRVEWLDPVDVRGLVIDDCVHIERGDVAVLPDREASQLDAPARVTLEGMRPKQKKSKGSGSNNDNSTVTDPATIAKYEKSLRRFCERNNLKFISYDSSSAQCVFETVSFSD